MTICDYAYKLVRPDAKSVGMNVAKMEVFKPLIAQPAASTQLLQLTANVDLSQSKAQLMFSSGSGKARVQHATCEVHFGDTGAWLAEWQRTAYLIQSRIDWLIAAQSTGKASKIGRGLAYKLFAALVEYDKKYRGMEEVVLSSEDMEATSRVVFQTTEEDGTFFCSPSGLTVWLIFPVSS